MCNAGTGTPFTGSTIAGTTSTKITSTFVPGIPIFMFSNQDNIIVIIVY